MAAFDYPAAPLVRIHGPRGYKTYESYRAWLRDEFAFRCVYCLARERWARVTGEYDLDHFVPQRINPDRKADYDNLVYACRRCNLAKSGESAPDPMRMTAQHLRVQPDGILRANSADAEALVLKLHLNALPMVE
jgi:HNH endonuclease